MGIESRFGFRGKKKETDSNVQPEPIQQRATIQQQAPDQQPPQVSPQPPVQSVSQEPVEAPMTDEEKFRRGVELINQRDFVGGYTLIHEAANHGHSMSQNMMGLAYFEKHGADRIFWDAFYWFTKSAEQGNAYAMYNLARMYLYGYGVAQSKENALEWYSKAQQAGHNDVSYMVIMLKRELGYQDINASVFDAFNYAMFYWNDAAYEIAVEKAQIFVSQGVRAANFILGMAYEKGFGLPKNWERAIECYRIAAEEGVADSSRILGQIYEYGRGVECNYQAALQWYQRAVQQGDAGSQRAVEVVLRKINVTDKVSVQQCMNAEFYYQQACEFEKKGMYSDASLHALYAVRQGHPGAAYMRAKYSQYGIGIRPNIQEAIPLYETALKGGVLDAYMELGRIYEYGLGVERNEEQAYEYYWKAQEWNLYDAHFSLHRLIKKNQILHNRFMQSQEAYNRETYEKRLQTAENFKAMDPEEWMRVTAIGAAFGYEDACENLGTACVKEAITRRNYSKAKANLEKYAPYSSSGINSKLAEVNTLMENEQRIDVFEKMSEDELFDLIEKAESEQQVYLAAWYGEILAKQGHAGAQCMMGEIYLNGMYEDGVIQNSNGEYVSFNDKCAFEWFLKAAEQGCETAYYYLGAMYGDGRYVERDLVQAKKYFEQAADAGDEDAKGALEEVKQQMSELGIEDNLTASKQEKSIRELEDLPENIDSYFDGIIGLEAVKEQLDTIYQSVKIKLMRDKILQERGESVVDNGQGYNFVLLGNPGTGKTMVARIIAKILYDIGIRTSEEFVEVDRSKLLSDHIGGTEKRVRSILEKTGGGTLFIDEAHALFKEESDSDFGQEVIDTLLKEMEDRRGEFSVIIAGYKKPMTAMMKNANSGFASRFSYIIELPDYTQEELITIAHTLVEQKKYVLADGVDEAIERCIHRDKIDDTFGNARYIRELVEKAIRNLAVRVHSTENFDEEMLFILKPEDFWNGEPEEGAKAYLAELNGLIGLPAVKREVQTLTNRITVQTEMAKRGLKGKNDFGTLHMAFKGNPGTGKTTVARIIGKLYASLGILKRKDVFVECSRATLVGQYQGSTAINVKKAVEQAMGGILFVDEAYSLVKGEGDTFGKEAVDTLVAEMENNRNNLIVIFAGYSNDLDEFFKNNQGLKSRVPIELIFEDYTGEELFEIACKMIRSNNYVLEPDAGNKLREVLVRESMKPDFGNARGVRNIVESCIRNQNDRIAVMLGDSDAVVTDAMLTLMQEEDI